VLTSDYKARNSRRPNHHGVDLADALDTPVYCSYDGTVVDVVKGGANGNPDLGGGFGNRVFVESGQYTHYYCHLSPEIPWSVGDEIKQGEFIGGQNNSGASRGVHLHWQVMDQSGKSLDPADFIEL
jgi:murein DD-endopeptidase MepM/ murein hydrolase activator NlpD